MVEEDQHVTLFSVECTVTQQLLQNTVQDQEASVLNIECRFDTRDVKTRVIRKYCIGSASALASERACDMPLLAGACLNLFGRGNACQDRLAPTRSRNAANLPLLFVSRLPPPRRVLSFLGSHPSKKTFLNFLCVKNFLSLTPTRLSLLGSD